MCANAKLTKSRTYKLAIAMCRSLAILIVMGSLAAAIQENNDDQQGNTEDPMQEIEETNQTMPASGEVPTFEFYGNCVLLPVMKTLALIDAEDRTCTLDIPMFSCYGYCDTSLEYSHKLKFKMETYILKTKAKCKCCEPVKLLSVYPRNPVICGEGHLWTGKRITFDIPIECECLFCKRRAGLP